MAAGHHGWWALWLAGQACGGYAPRISASLNLIPDEPLACSAPCVVNIPEHGTDLTEARSNMP